MKKTILSLLRDKNTTTEVFRKSADQIGTWLAFQASELIEKEQVALETPVAKTTGYQIKKDIVLLPVLRAGIALLNPFMRLFPSSKVGFIGIRRDEETALPSLYYKNIPSIAPSDMVIILDPMIATGGSGGVVIKMLKELKVHEEQIIYAGVVAAPEGLSAIQELAPKMKVISAEVDEKLNDKKYIVPGLGDFGDRYFGT
jgi:uracil phosphoribosyltransferase